MSLVDLLEDGQDGEESDEDEDEVEADDAVEIDFDTLLDDD